MGGGFNIEWLFLKIYDFFTGGFHFTTDNGFFRTLGFIFSLVAVFFFGVIVYSVMRLKERNKLNHHLLDEKIEALNHVKKENKNERWSAVVEHISSPKEGDWRIAIIEADAMLDKLTKDMGLIGNDLGDRLRNAPTGDFQTLDNAWEAHKLRNRIAHEGLNFKLEYREAKKAIEMYESVFNEFGLI